MHLPDCSFICITTEENVLVQNTNVLANGIFEYALKLFFCNHTLFMVIKNGVKYFSILFFKVYIKKTHTFIYRNI